MYYVLFDPIYYSFPKDKSLRKEWIRTCNLPEINVSASLTVLCSKHFEKKDFNNLTDGKVPKRVRLQKDAILSIFCRYINFVSLSTFVASFS